MLITVKDACKLQPNALEIRVSDQLEQLDDLINKENSGIDFFERTYITAGMDILLREGIARLASKSNQAIFHLKQAMGGGKTHLLVGFGLIAKDPNLRQKICSAYSYINDFSHARVSAFNGRNTPSHYFWGEIAEQLGKAELFSEFWSSGPKAPDERDWLKLFEGNEPILILLDEMPPYFNYLDTQKVGNGTVADIATRAFSNMLTAAGKKANICVVVSDLSTTYKSGISLINKALYDAEQELGRQERTITPVDLAGNEIYQILRKRLFLDIPNKSEIEQIASKFGEEISNAAKAKVITRNSESIVDEIVETYPFHPRLKNVIALFKENEKFKQTRGLMELISRLLLSVWNRKSNDVYLIGPQHFDLSVAEVREKIVEISELQDVIATDLWDINCSAHAQHIDIKRKTDAAAQIGSLLLISSLSTAVNSVKGLTTEEIIETVITFNRNPSEFIESFKILQNDAWYLHQTSEGRFYFDRQENLTKLLQSLASSAPENQIDSLIRHRLIELFAPSRKSVYQEVLPLPKLEEISDKIRQGRTLIIISPDSKLPPDIINTYFDSLTQKNNFCILTGDKTQFASIEKAARHSFAAKKADIRIAKGHLQREELEKKQNQYDFDLTTTILTIFDKIIFPIHRSNKKPELVSRTLETTRDSSKPYNGEEQIEKTLSTDPRKYFSDIQNNFDILRDKSETLLWPQGQSETRWIDCVEHMAEFCGFPWIPPKGLEELRIICCSQGLWEDLGNGYISKRPQKKKTSAQIIPDGERDDSGYVRLRISTLNAGPVPQVYYSENETATTSSTLLTDTFIDTTAVKISVLVIDPSGQFETGEAVTQNIPYTIRNKLDEVGGKRMVTLYAHPSRNIKYTLDASEPRSGLTYDKPFQIDDTDVTLLVYSEVDGVEARGDFKFPPIGKNSVSIDNSKPATLIASRGNKKLDARQKVFSALKDSQNSTIFFENVVLTIGDGTKSATLQIGELEKVSGLYLESVLLAVLTIFSDNAPITIAFKKAYFCSGFDLNRFCETHLIDIQPGEVQQ
jgi:hypothetical protein